jgi:predicted peroxiredoxin
MEKQKQTEGINECEELSRGDFLKMAGIAGLGIASLGAFMNPPASAQEGKKKKYLFVVSSGANNPNKATLALILADVVQKKEFGDVNIWLVLEGAELCRKGHAEKIVGPAYQKFGNAFDMIERIRKNGGKFGVCPPCAEWVGATGNNRIEYVEDQGGDWLMKNIQDSIVVWL